MENFLSFEEAKQQNQTKQHKNKFYMSDTKDIIIFQVIANNEQMLYKSPLLRDTYKESQRYWNNICEKKTDKQKSTQEKPKQVFHSRDEFLRANCPFTDDELCEIAEAESKMYD